MKVLIVGAGIAGLSLARALLSHGLRPDVIERRPGWSDPGLGMFLPGNASRAFGQLGLLPAIIEKAVAIPRQDFFDFRGARLSSIDTAAFWRECGPCLSLPRGTMHAILRASIGELPIQTTRTVSDLEPVEGGCIATFNDGADERYDLVVGADGVNSKVRRLAFEDGPPLYSGNVCWRFFVPNTARIDGWTVMLAKGRTLLAIPVEPGMLYVYADVSTPRNATDRFGPETDLRALFGDFGAPLAPLLAAPPSSEVHFSRIDTVRTSSQFKGRVVLIGDAAHACSPSMAEGAGMACEDAIVLAGAIATATDLDTALAGYVARRQPRVSWVEAQSEARDRMRRLPLPISSLLLRSAGTALYARTYRPLLRPI